ncbi:MAG: hypothetical protein HN904_10945 [Victivallales bacterium]|nr:hypothetical protein [Victivallales bacterium]
MGSSSATFAVTAIDDALIDGTQTVTISATATGFSSASDTLAVTNDDLGQTPTIGTQPQPLTVMGGESATFTVAASGTATLTYQWQLAGTDIAGATGTTYTIAASQEADEGDYRCVVTNGVGSVASATAALTVIDSSWLVDISVTNGSPGTITFGVHPDATDAADGDYDEPIPPGLAAGVAQVAWIAPGDGTKLSRDLQGALADGQWQVEVDASGSATSTTLSWSSATIPSEDLRVRRLTGLDGGPVADTEVWMARETQLTVAAGTLAYFLLEENDAPTIANHAFSVAASSGDDALVGIVTGTDPDPADPLTYSLTAGNAARVFALDDASGQITVADSSALDSQRTLTHMLTVQVTDSGGLTASATVGILIYDGWLLTIQGDDGEQLSDVQLGTTTGATADFDDGTDALATAGAAILLSGLDDTRHELWRDMRDPAAESEWFLVVPAGTGDLTLTWDSATLPDGGLRLQEVSADDGSLVAGTAIEMSDTDSLVVDRAAARLFRITTMPLEFELVLVRGWNLISLPMDPTDPAVDAVLGEGTRWGPVWMWDTTLNNGNGAYVAAVEFAPLVGYWVFMREPVTIVVTGSLLAETNVDLAVGWNLVGVAEETALGDFPGSCWRWDNTKPCYCPVQPDDTLLPGHGYWLRALEETTLGPEVR